ncbi:MAG: hypothetical protein R3B48_29835 [Kofleriaceae bacterium]
MAVSWTASAAAQPKPASPAAQPRPASSAPAATAQPKPTSPAPATGDTPPRRAESLEIDDCGPKPALPADKLRQLAGEHYDRGDVLYVQGDYVGAVSELVSSYCLIPHYRVLKDIGQAYERQLEYSRAIAYLKRYVAGVPDDAKAAPCAPDPAEDKRNVSARIEVLSTLPARIRVATEPDGAEITLTGEDGLVARGVSTPGGGLILARAGRYEMTLRKPGFVAQTSTVVAEIGKPYSYFFQLTREQGRLTVQSVPSNARLFLDDRFIGIGRFDADLPGDRYTLVVEATDRISERRVIEVTPKHTERVVVRLSAKPQSGRTQMLIYGGIAGGVVLSSALSGTAGNVATIGGVAGLAVGGVSGYIAIPEDLPLGVSSLTITGSIAGGITGLVLSTGFSDADAFVGPSTALGTVGGGAAGYFLGDRLDITPGDAALINSGVLWGGVYGGLFAIAFDPPGSVGAGLGAGGMALGLATSTLLARSFSISRSHAALIDLGGVGGLVLSAAVQSIVDRGDDVTVERQTNFAIGGLTVGLAAAALLTRNYDSPALPNVQPSLGRVSAADGTATPSYGITGRF